jgi:hypothetical protein
MVASFWQQLWDKGVDVTASFISNLLASGLVAAVGLYFFQRLSIEREVKIRRQLRLEQLKSTKARLFERASGEFENLAQFSGLASAWVEWMKNEGLEPIGENIFRKDRWTSGGETRFFLAGDEGRRRALEQLRKDIQTTELQ